MSRFWNTAVKVRNARLAPREKDGYSHPRVDIKGYGITNARNRASHTKQQAHAASQQSHNIHICLLQYLSMRMGHH